MRLSDARHAIRPSGARRQTPRANVTHKTHIPLAPYPAHAGWSEYAHHAPNMSAPNTPSRTKSQAYKAQRPTGKDTDGAFCMRVLEDKEGQCVQIRRNTRVPLVPPNPKLFFKATSIFTSRATLAQ